MKKSFKWFKENHEFIALVFVIIGLLFTYVQMRLNSRDSKYMYLTGVWNDIMKESINLPQFNDKSKTLIYKEAFQGDQRQEYQSYIRWVGGFIEDLYFNGYDKKEWLFFKVYLIKDAWLFYDP